MKNFLDDGGKKLSAWDIAPYVQDSRFGQITVAPSFRWRKKLEENK